MVANVCMVLEFPFTVCHDQRNTNSRIMQKAHLRVRITCINVACMSSWEGMNRVYRVRACDRAYFGRRCDECSIGLGRTLTDWANIHSVRSLSLLSELSPCYTYRGISSPLESVVVLCPTFGFYNTSILRFLKGLLYFRVYFYNAFFFVCLYVKSHYHIKNVPIHKFIIK